MATTENKYQYFDDGLDGFPVFGFRPGSEVKQPYRLYLPEKLPAEFDLVATFKPTSVRTSYLFAVLNPFETVVQLGIRISVSIIIVTIYNDDYEDLVIGDQSESATHFTTHRSV